MRVHTHSHTHKHTLAHPHTCYPTALIIFPLYQQEPRLKHFTAADVRPTRSGGPAAGHPGGTKQTGTTTQHKASTLPSNQARTLVWFFPVIKKHGQEQYWKKQTKKNSYVLPLSVITFHSRARPTLAWLRQTNHSRLREVTHVELMWTYFACRALGGEREGKRSSKPRYGTVWPQAEHSFF